LSADEARRLSEVLKALADPARLRLVSIISSCGEACVCDLQEPLGLSQPTVSHHLKVLADAGVVSREQRGRWAYYRLDSATLALVAASLSPDPVAALSATEPKATIA
jgi:ArsR family transcriptional regulator